METLMPQIFRILLVVVSLIFSLSQTAITQQDYQTIYDIEWHPNEDILAVASDTGIWLYNPSLENISHLEEGGRNLEWSPDGNYLAIIGSDITIFNIDTETQVLRIERQANTYEAEWHPQKNEIVVVNGHLIQIWDTLTGQMLHEMKTNQFTIRSTHWSPNGRQLATANEYEKLIHIWDVETETILLTIPHSTGVREIEWSQHGKKLAVVGGGDIAIWDLATLQLETILAGHTKGVVDVDWKKSYYLASAGLDKTIRVWDTTTGQNIKIIQENNFLNAVKWSASGQYLAYMGRSNPHMLKIISLAEIEN